MIVYFIFYLSLFLQPNTFDPQTTIHLDEVAPPSDYANATLRIEAGLKALRQSEADTLIIPPGQYMLSERRGRVHLRIHHLQGKTIMANGAVFLLQHPGYGGLLIEQVEQFNLIGGRIDWVHPLFIQGEISEVHEIGGYVDVHLSAPEASLDAKLWSKTNAWGTLFKPNGERHLAMNRSVMRVKEVHPLGHDGARVYFQQRKDLVRKGLDTGNTLVVVGRTQRAHAITVQEASDLKIEGVRIQFSPSMAIMVHPRCRNVSLIDNVIEPVGDRLISTNADGIHVIEPVGYLRIEGNQLYRLQDDAIVVSRRGQWATGRAGQGTLVIRKPHRSVQFEHGDGLCVFQKGMSPNCSLKIKEAKLGPKGALHVKTDPLFKGDLHKGDRVLIFPVADVDARVDIRRNVVDNIRGRGLRIHYAKVVIEDNIISRTTGPGLLSGPLLSEKWLPQFPAVSMSVMGNTFKGFKVKKKSVLGRVTATNREFGVIWFNDRPDLGLVSQDVSVGSNTFEGDLGYASHAIYANKKSNIRIHDNDGVEQKTHIKLEEQ